ncbi:MAG TPA: sulfatase [Opitutaceae bacterium]|nr:sulfatase [Opitutaceae bacterium]
MSAPNIVYIHSHDTGRHVQPYGHAVPTPNLQRLAEEGVLFRQAFCSNPTCSPSRASLLTGQCAHSSGMLGLAHRGFSLADYGRLLPHTLARAGYLTVIAGLQHIALFRGRHDAVYRQLGYDRHFGNQGEAEENAAQFLDNAPRQPFFLDVGFWETHREFPAHGEDIKPGYCLPPAPLPDTPQTRLDVANFKQMARVLDRKMGRVFDALDRNGLAGNTLVVCTTDHGIAFPRMKCDLTDSGTGVMLVLRGPGAFGGGRVIDSMVSHLDIFPTICELAGIKPPAWLQGASLCALVRGESSALHDALFSEVNYHAAYEPKRAVRTSRWKYIRRYDPCGKTILPNTDESPSKDCLLAHDWKNRHTEPELLHDLVYDPHEAANLCGEPGHAGVLAEMRARLDGWMRETDDPILRGLPVRAPEGAVANRIDGASSGDEPMQINHDSIG